MRTDIGIFLEGTIEGRLLQLTSSDSPLRLEGKMDDFYVLRAKDGSIDGVFIYGTPDSEIISEDPLHIESQKALGFKTGIHLDYYKNDITPQKAKFFRKLVDYLTREGIPFYMTARDEYDEEIMIRGHNPVTNTEISNPGFTETCHELIE